VIAEKPWAIDGVLLLFLGIITTYCLGMMPIKVKPKFGPFLVFSGLFLISHSAVMKSSEPPPNWRKLWLTHLIVMIRVLQEDRFPAVSPVHQMVDRPLSSLPDPARLTIPSTRTTMKPWIFTSWSSK